MEWEGGFRASDHGKGEGKLRRTMLRVLIVLVSLLPINGAAPDFSVAIVGLYEERINRWPVHGVQPRRTHNANHAR